MTQTRKLRKPQFQPSLRGGRSSRRSNRPALRGDCFAKNTRNDGLSRIPESNIDLQSWPLLLEPQPEGGYTVTCPTFPELITEGENKEEALENVEDALKAIVEAFSFLRRPLPRSLQSP